mgnify:CR=1 FL=1
MSERTTGATPEQVEAAAKSWWEEENQLADWKWEHSGTDRKAKLINELQDAARDDVRAVARHLVPPDERIVKEEHLRAVLAWIGDDERYADPDESAAIARLREVLGDAWH